MVLDRLRDRRRYAALLGRAAMPESPTTAALHNGLAIGKVHRARYRSRYESANDIGSLRVSKLPLLVAFLRYGSHPPTVGTVTNDWVNVSLNPAGSWL